MAKQKMTDVRTMSADQVTKRLGEIAKAQLNTRFQKASGQAEKTHEARLLRREKARLRTLQSERRLAAASA